MCHAFLTDSRFYRFCSNLIRILPVRFEPRDVHVAVLFIVPVIHVSPADFVLRWMHPIRPVSVSAAPTMAVDDAAHRPLCVSSAGRCIWV